MGDAVVSPREALVKRRREDGAGMRRVAEIVMVLAAAGEVRAGREPTAAERTLVAEARERLAATVAEGAVRPKDLFPGEAVRAVVEDLGLNRARDPAVMGFRPPKASIADRLMLTKRKMEEVKEYPAQPTAITPQTTASSGTAEFQGLHGAPMFAVGAPRNSPAVAALPSTGPATSTSVMVLKPHGSSPVKSITNPSVVAPPHTGQPHLNYDKGVNGPSNLTRATAGHLNKSFLDTSARSNQNATGSTNQVMRNQATKVATVQPVTGNPVTGHHATPGTSSVTTKSIFGNHIGIAKKVQLFLQQPSNHPSWTPPSTSYMNTRLDCQICKVSIMDASSLLVCDACERGAHLKCLQHYGNKGVPTVDWYCPTCVSQSKGKPLAPKYGKVTRTVVPSQTGPSCGGTPLSVQAGAENMAAKENHQKVVAGNPIKPKSTQAGSTVHNSTILALNAATASSQSISVSRPSRPAEGNANNAETSSNEYEGNEQQCSSTGQHNVTSPCEVESSELGTGSSYGTHSGKSPNEKVSSGFSLQSVDSENNVVYGHQSAVTSGAHCSNTNTSFAATAEAKISLEPHSEAALSRDVEMVDNSKQFMDQTINFGSEVKIGIEATSESDTTKDAETTTNIETPIDQGTNIPAENKVDLEANSEPHTDVEMTTSNETPICQSSNIAVEEKLQTDSISEPHAIKEMEMIVNTATSMDKKCNVETEEKPQSEPTSVVKTMQVITTAGMLTDETQLANGSTENGVTEPPIGESYIDKSDFSAMSDPQSTYQMEV